MPEGLDFEDVLKALGALALILGPAATWRVGKATAAAATRAADAQRVAADAQREALVLEARNVALAAQTARLELEFEVIKAGRETWEEMFRAAVAKVDNIERQMGVLDTLHRECLVKVATLTRIVQGRQRRRRD